MKKTLLVILASAIVCVLGANAHAGAWQKGPEKGWSLEDKLCKKAKMALDNEEELNLTAEQVGNIKKLTLNVKKEMIRTDAEIKLLSLDIKALLREDKVDVKTISGLVDKKYELKKGKTKYMVQAYSDLKDILTKDQKTGLEKICKTSVKCKMCPVMCGKK